MGESAENNSKTVSNEGDDENGLELSLGLSCGGSFSKGKGKESGKETSVDSDGVEKTKNGTVSAGDVSLKQPDESTAKTQQSFWVDLGNASSKGPEGSLENSTIQTQLSGHKEGWLTGENSAQNPQTSKQSETGNAEQQKQNENQPEGESEKRGMAAVTDLTGEEEKNKRQKVEEQKQQIKVDVEDDKVDEATKSSSAAQSQKRSVAISGADNEDAVDSEVEASSSTVVSTVTKESLKQSMIGGDQGEKKEIQVTILQSTNGADSKQDHNHAPVVTSVTMTSAAMPYSYQPFSVANAPYGHTPQVTNNATVQYPTGYSLPYLTQYTMPNVNGAERTVVRPINSSAFQLPHNYSSFQFPTPENPPSAWFSGSHSHPSHGFSSRNVVRASMEHVDEQARTAQASMVLPHGAMGYFRQVSSEVASSQEGQKIELTQSFKNNDRQLERTVSDVGSTCLSSKAAEEEARSHGSTDHLPNLDTLSQEFWNIRPGIAPGLKFGGTGNSPDLPWVTTTGTGLNGKTISGVMYRYNKNQLKIVCACHGRHMLPMEFVQHANGVEVNMDNGGAVVSSLSSSGHVTSAHS